MTLKSRDPIAIDPGVKLKKNERRFPWIRTQLLNIRTSGDKMKMPIAAEETMLFQEGLFILFLLGIEEPTCKREKKNEKWWWPLVYPSTQPKSSHVSSPPSPHNMSLVFKLKPITNSPTMAELLVSLILQTQTTAFIFILRIVILEEKR